MTITPMMQGVYSPFSAFLDDIGDSLAPVEQGAPPTYRYIVTGLVIFENGTYASGVEVRIFATDQLIEETVFTDLTGRFVSSNTYSDGQILTIEVLEKQFTSFIDYRISPDSYLQGTEYVDLGAFVIVP